MLATRRRVFPGAGWRKAIVLTGRFTLGYVIAVKAMAAGLPAIPEAVAVHRSWSVQCVQRGHGWASCEVAQTVHDRAQAMGSVLRFAMSCTEMPQACAVHLEMPPGTDPRSPILLQSGRDIPLELPLIDCDRKRCLAGGAMPWGLSNNIARAEEIRVRFGDRIAGPQDIPLSTEGFGDAFADMVGRNIPMAVDRRNVFEKEREDTMISLLAATALASATTPSQVRTPASPPSATAVSSTVPQPERYGDWSVLCIEREGLPPCEVVQGVQAKDANTQPLRFSFAYAGQGDRYGVQFQVPLGVLVQVQPLIRLDDKTDLTDFRITRCETEGCFIDRVMARTELEPFFKAVKGLIAVADRAGKPIVLPLSLNGFGQAMQAMTAKNQSWAKSHPVPAVAQGKPLTPAMPR